MKLMSKIGKIAQFILLFELGDILINPAKNKLYAQVNVQSQISDDLKNLTKNNPDQMKVDGVIINSPLIGFYEDKAKIISYIKKLEIDNKDYIIKYTVYLKNKPEPENIYSFKYKPKKFIDNNRDNYFQEYINSKNFEHSFNESSESLEFFIKDKNNYIRVSQTQGLLNFIKEKRYK